MTGSLNNGDDRRSLADARRAAARYLAGARRAWHPKYTLAFTIAHLFPAFSAGPLITRLYRLAGFTIGEGTTLIGPLRILSGTEFEENLVIGRGVTIANDVTINVDGLVTIDDAASIGPFVRIYTGTHAIGPGSRRMMPLVSSRPVTIGRGCWVGVGSIVMPGVTIGDGCVIGAGSVIVSDIEPHSYAEGNPAKVVRSLPWKDR